MRWFLLVVSLLTLPCQVGAAALPDFVPVEHRKAVTNWLEKHPGYRLANTDDCACADDIAAIQRGAGGAWKAEPEYRPYVARGDFDGDGMADIAFVMLPGELSCKTLVLVSFGPHGAEAQSFQLPIPSNGVSGYGLFVRPSSQDAQRQHQRLLFGAFESEAEEVVITRRTTSNQ